MEVLAFFSLEDVISKNGCEILSCTESLYVLEISHQ